MPLENPAEDRYSVEISCGDGISARPTRPTDWDHSTTLADSESDGESMPLAQDERYDVRDGDAEHDAERLMHELAARSIDGLIHDASHPRHQAERLDSPRDADLQARNDVALLLDGVHWARRGRLQEAMLARQLSPAKQEFLASRDGRAVQKEWARGYRRSMPGMERMREALLKDRVDSDAGMLELKRQLEVAVRLLLDDVDLAYSRELRDRT